MQLQIGGDNTEQQNDLQSYEIRELSQLRWNRTSPLVIKKKPEIKMNEE
jgi:hypothetical protein